MSRKKHYDFYDDQFKATAVTLGSLPGVQAQAVAGVLDIHPVMLYRWKKELREGKIMEMSAKGSLDTETKKELARLRRVEKAHEQLEQTIGTRFYFANPHHSWERGSNENTNGLIRQYLPKGKTMAQLTQRDCDAIARKLNTRPRKRLGYKTQEQCYASA